MLVFFFYNMQHLAFDFHRKQRKKGIVQHELVFALETESSDPLLIYTPDPPPPHLSRICPLPISSFTAQELSLLSGCVDKGMGVLGVGGPICKFNHCLIT